jgi:tetratricopeptide (TPR) repeat protein
MEARQAYDEGIDFLRRRQSTTPSRPFAVLGRRRGLRRSLGRTRARARRLEHHEQAAEALERAWFSARLLHRQVHPRHPCNALGRWNNALECFEEILSRHPSFIAYPEFHYQRGRALMGLHRWDDAAESMREAVRINPNYSQAHWELARIYDMLGFAPLSEEAHAPPCASIPPCGIRRSSRPGGSTGAPDAAAATDDGSGSDTANIGAIDRFRRNPMKKTNAVALLDKLGILTTRWNIRGRRGRERRERRLQVGKPLSASQDSRGRGDRTGVLVAPFPAAPSWI